MWPGSYNTWFDWEKRALTAARVANADWHVLRFPFLDGGMNQARHDGAAGWLKSQGNRRLTFTS